jgi:hypothetical protein
VDTPGCGDTPTSLDFPRGPCNVVITGAGAPGQLNREETPMGDRDGDDEPDEASDVEETSAWQCPYCSATESCVPGDEMMWTFLHILSEHEDE